MVECTFSTENLEDSKKRCIFAASYTSNPMTQTPKDTPTHRRHNPYHDYREACIYHITLVCSDRGQVLGRIVGGNLDEARCELTPLGAAISQQIRNIAYHTAQRGRKVQVIAKAVMPDHIHFILYVQERLTDCTLGDIIRGFKQGCNKALRAALEAQERAKAITALPTKGIHGMDAEGHDEHTPNTAANVPIATTVYDAKNHHYIAEPPAAVSCSSSLSEGIPCPSSPSQPSGYRQRPLPIRSPRMIGQHALFEEDYDETILRRRGQLQAMIRYVHNNPKHRWLKQRHPDRLVPIRGIMIAGRSYDAIGNVTLLGLPRQQVWVRSRWDDATRRNYQNGSIVKARRFHALVSPFISPHEAAVRDVALQEGHAIIVLTDNGFSDYTQCPGGLYDYCVKGQVLLLVPSELPHIANKGVITRAECTLLNARAAEIADEGMGT